MDKLLEVGGFEEGAERAGSFNPYFDG